MDNLEHFPTSPSALEMLRDVSPVYSESYVGKWLFQVMGAQTDKVWGYFEDLIYQAFPETCTWSIEWWERKYHIPVDRALTLEERRARLKMKQAARSPMNPAVLEMIVEAFTTNTVDADVIEHFADYTFLLLLHLNGRSGYSDEEIISLVRRVIPSHLNFVLRSQLQLPDADAIHAAFLSTVVDTTISPRLPQQVQTAGEIVAAGLLFAINTVVIEPYALAEIYLSSGIYAGDFLSSVQTVTVYPKHTPVSMDTNGISGCFVSAVQSITIHPKEV